jgi:hypothetical protein
MTPPLHLEYLLDLMIAVYYNKSINPVVWILLPDWKKLKPEACYDW